MISVADVISALDEWAPFESAASWDPVGLQVGDPRTTVTTAAVCHEVTNEVVGAVVESDVDVLITYHPLLFRPVSRLIPGAGPAGMAYELARQDVSVVASHTNLDAAPGGTADSLASALGLTDVRAFGEVDGSDTVKVVVFVPSEAAEDVRSAMAEAGAGEIGLYRSCSFEAPGRGRFVAPEGTDPAVGSVGSDNAVDELRLEMNAATRHRAAVVEAARAAHPYEEPAIDVYGLLAGGPAIGRIGVLEEPVELKSFVHSVGEALGNPPVRYSYAGTDVVQDVAVVPGAGSDFAAEARAKGAQVLVTGDARHHATVAASRGGLAIVDATHEGSERPGMQALYRFATTIVNTIDLTSLSTNPWNSP